MVKFLDLKEINSGYQEELVKAFRSVLDSGWYIQGENVTKFENQFANYCGANYCAGTASGLDALKLVIRAWKDLGLLTNGDEVIVPANTYIASILAITENGLVPRLIEPDEASYNISSKSILRAINKKTKMILPVHLYGRLAPMAEIMNIANDHNLLVLEDAAQAHGARRDGKKAGAWGHAAAFSFYPGKNLGALGDAGALVSDNEHLMDHVRRLGNYGSSEKYVHTVQGINSRLDEIQAALLLVKLRDLDKSTARRRDIARKYNDRIRHPQIITPLLGDEDHVHHLYVLRSRFRDSLVAHLEARGINTLIHYPIAPHKQQAYPALNKIKLPLTERLAKEVLSIPISPGMSEADVDSVVLACNSYSA